MRRRSTRTRSLASWALRSAFAVLLIGCGREIPAAPAASVAPAIATHTPCPGANRVVLENYRFVPACFTIRASRGLSLHNAGDVVHNVSIPTTLVDLDTRPGENTNTEAIGGVVRPGVYEFFCKYHRSRGMTGTLTVLP